MKTKYYILVGLILVVILIGVCLQKIGQLPETPLESYKICDKWQDVEVSKIHLCENSQGNKIYIQMFRCEDCPNFYFDINKNFIQQCSTYPLDTSEACKRLFDYTCDFEENLFDTFCE